MKSFIVSVFVVLTITLAAIDCPAQWEVIGFADGVNKIDFVDFNHGWLYQWEYQQFHRTTNAGKSWEIFKPQGFGHLEGRHDMLLHFTDTTNGYALRSLGVLYKTKDAGYNWDSIAQDMTCFTAIDSLTVFGYGRGILHFSSDGGLQWRTTDLTADSILSMAMFDRTHGIACAVGGAVKHTLDGGLMEWDEKIGPVVS